MAGLLYKDFVAIRGKIYVIISVATLLLITLLRWLIRDDAGEYLLVMYIIAFPVAAYTLVSNKIETDLMRIDEAKKQRQYCHSLPVSKKQYVASKYVFMLVVYFIVQSMVALLCSIMVVGNVTNLCMEFATLIMGCIPILTTTVMVISAMELPFFIVAGYQKGNLIKQGLLEAFFAIFVVYLMFGDLTIFENFSVDAIVTWTNNHQDVLNAMHVITPLIGLAVYYISYRISCFLYERRELSDD